MNPYPKYKPSGIEWIGEIPEQWNIMSLKYSDSIIMGQSPDSQDYSDDEKHLPFLQGNADFKEIYPLPRIYCETANKTAKTNDILMSVRAPVGAVNIADKNYGIGRGLCAIRSVHSNYKFIYYQTLIKNKEFNSISSGSTFTAIAVEDVKNSKYIIPSLPEQTTIANYLDKKTALFDKTITKKEKLIELLEEERKAIINQAVTKGLNPDVKMKDSGIEWLGKVPKHWEVKKLKYLVSELISGPFGSSLKKEIYVSNGYKIYGQEQVIPNDFEIGDYFISGEKFEEMRRYEIATNDILISCVGTFGKIALVPENFKKGIINPRLIKLRPDLRIINPKFLYVILKSSYSYFQFEAISRGGTMGVINIELLSNLILCIPTINEQLEIVSYILSKNQHIRKTIKNIQKEIELLKEYRQALIFEAVTGKIDLRDEK